MHEQKFEDLPSSKCPLRVEGACWTCNLGPVVQYSLGAIFCYCNFRFHMVKTLKSILALLPFLFNYEKTRKVKQLIEDQSIKKSCDDVIRGRRNMKK